MSKKNPQAIFAPKKPIDPGRDMLYYDMAGLLGEVSLPPIRRIWSIAGKDPAQKKTASGGKKT